MRPLFGIAASLLCLLAAVPVNAAEQGLYGFDRAGMARELSIEQTYLTLPSSPGAALSVASLTEHARLAAGGEGDAARWVADQLSSYGWNARVVPIPLAATAPRTPGRRKGKLIDVVATLPGRKADLAIVLGARRQARAFGAADDAGSIATLMEVARGLGYLYRSGWRPERTIAIVSFGGGAIGEPGSYALAPSHQLHARIAAYVDCDACATGSHFEAGAAAPLSALVRESARIVPDSGGTMLSQHLDGNIGLPESPEGVVFTHGLGVPTLDVRFSGLFGDPSYMHHRELAQLIGTLTLRLADACSLPMRWSAYDARLDATLRQLSLEVKHSDLPIDLQDLRMAVRAFEESAARADALIAAGTMPDAHQLDAAEALVARVSDGPFHVIYSDPLAAGNEERIEWKVQATATALRRASSLLAETS